MIPAYDAADIHRLLDMPGCIAAVRDAMARFSADGTPQPLRSVTELEPGKLFALMPGSLVAPDGFGAKLLSVVSDPERPGRSRHLGLVVLFDRATGELRCTGDAESITAIRTAAASAVATDALARPNARRAAVFGTGEQARSHVQAMALVRPFDEIVIWGRSADAAERLIAELQPDLAVSLRFEPDGRAAAAGADVICTVTGATTPILFNEWVRDGTHINVVGSGFVGPVEIDNALVARAYYVADSRLSALAAAAEFLDAKSAGLIDDDHIRAEIGEILNGTAPGRPCDAAVTIYKSLGHVVQDLAAMAYVDDRATALA